MLLWGFAPNPTRFLKKAGQKLSQNRAQRDFK